MREVFSRLTHEALMAFSKPGERRESGLRTG